MASVVEGGPERQGQTRADKCGDLSCVGSVGSSDWGRLGLLKTLGEVEGTMLRRERERAGGEQRARGDEGQEGQLCL